MARTPLLQSPFLRSLPIPAFAMVMGVSGLSLAWARAVPLLGVWAIDVSRALGLIAAGLFSTLLLLYLRKLMRRPVGARDEWQHPVKSAFFAAVSVSFALLGAVALVHAPALAQPLWALGASLQLLVMLLVLNAWVHRPSLQPAHASPIWFIPAVANVVIPLAGVPLGFVVISWWFFAVGILFWGLLLTVVMARLLFVQPPLPSPLTPSLAIFLAPPTVGFLSWIQLTGQAPALATPVLAPALVSTPTLLLPLDGAGQALFGLALFFALFLLTQAPRWIRLPFGLPSWALSFPSAAFAATVLAYGHFSQHPGLVGLQAVALAWASLLIAGLLLRTLWAVWRQEPVLMA